MLIVKVKQVYTCVFSFLNRVSISLSLYLLLLSPPPKVWQIKNQYSKTRARRYNALGRDSDMEWSINSTDPLKFQITYIGGDTHENKNRYNIIPQPSIYSVWPI